MSITLQFQRGYHCFDGGGLKGYSNQKSRATDCSGSIRNAFDHKTRSVEGRPATCAHLSSYKTLVSICRLCSGLEAESAEQFAPWCSSRSCSSFWFKRFCESFLVKVTVQQHSSVFGIQCFEEQCCSKIK